ncbi:SLATT domain-containing protein [uncultured Corynebacterium sp.]|uniref:SLATT domain-containing protein n=1 Tax=uncultured Corynebacterium sp. TaxID=159447 RepID=UPI00259204A8|nr:SLATT domain-containing protein [uncultured Corynebacterium sp.]
MDKRGNSNSVAALTGLLDARRDRMLYTYRTQEKAADRYQQWEKCRKTTSIILTALTAGAFLASLGGLFFDPEVNAVLVSGAAALATMLTFLGESVDWKMSVEAHRAAAVDLRAIHNRYESLTWDIENDAISLEDALVKRDELERDERNLLSKSPRTTRGDYNKADEAIKGNEKPQSTQKEIDARTLWRRK